MRKTVQISPRFFAFTQNCSAWFPLKNTRKVRKGREFISVEFGRSMDGRNIDNNWRFKFNLYTSCAFLWNNRKYSKLTTILIQSFGFQRRTILEELYAHTVWLLVGRYSCVMVVVCFITLVCTHLINLKVYYDIYKCKKKNVTSFSYLTRLIQFFFCWKTPKRLRNAHAARRRLLLI